jgi:hypothetical protein
MCTVQSHVSCVLKTHCSCRISSLYLLYSLIGLLSLYFCCNVLLFTLFRIKCYILCLLFYKYLNLLPYFSRSNFFVFEANLRIEPKSSQTFCLLMFCFVSEFFWDDKKLCFVFKKTLVKFEKFLVVKIQDRIKSFCFVLCHYQIYCFASIL